MSFKKNVKGGGKNIYIDSPQLEDKDGLIGLYQKMVYQISLMLSSPELSREPMNILFQLNLIISVVPGGEKVRNDLYKRQKEIYSVLEKEYKELWHTATLSEGQQSLLLILSTLRGLGYANDQFDRLAGKTLINRVGFCIDKNEGIVPESVGFSESDLPQPSIPEDDENE